MAVVQVNSTAVANANALPRIQNPRGLADGEVVRAVHALIAIANGDSVGSVYRLGKIRSSDFVDDIVIDAPDIGTTTAGDIGLYDLLTAPNAGAVVDVDFFGSAVPLNAGPYNRASVRFEAGAAGGSIANAEKRVWEALGLAADPNKEYDVALTLTGAADAAGSALFRVYVVR